ncbi:hypothetical protein MKX03_001431, partial [Papaver bracteatum]
MSSLQLAPPLTHGPSAIAQQTPSRTPSSSATATSSPNRTASYSPPTLSATASTQTTPSFPEPVQSSSVPAAVSSFVPAAVSSSIPAAASTELVRILLQIAQRNSLDVDVDLALGFASHYSKIGTMECSGEEGNAVMFLGPLMRAAERGCMQVFKWFVQRGCREMELCLALTAATSSSQVGIAAYLLPHVPQHVLAALSIEILKIAGERSGWSLDGVAFLLRSDFLGDPDATYAGGDSIAKSDDEVVAAELRDFLREHWSETAFLEGLRREQDHYVNVMRILRR